MAEEQGQTADGVRIRLNGRPRTVPAGLSVADLLERLELERRAVVVELNREIVRGDALDARRVAEGDELEIVHFVGGGGPRTTEPGSRAFRASQEPGADGGTA